MDIRGCSLQCCFCKWLEENAVTVLGMRSVRQALQLPDGPRGSDEHAFGCLQCSNHCNCCPPCSPGQAVFMLHCCAALNKPSRTIHQPIGLWPCVVCIGGCYHRLQWR